MKFLYPYFLFALLAVGIPLIIHLFNFKRYKTVYFSNVSFLKAVKKEAKKKSRLKQILILISRMLAVGCLVIAFCQPYISLTERKQQNARQAVAIYIDNSFSMRLEGEAGILLEQARNKAIEIADSYRPGTKFLLITNDFLPRHRYLFDKSQLISQLEELAVSPATVDFKRVNNFARQQLKDAGKRFDKTFYVLSDFQKNNFDFPELKADTTLWTYLMPFSSGKTNNLYIDSCWFEVPGRKMNQAEKLYVRVINSSSEDYQNIPVRLKINDSLKAVSTINMVAGETQMVEMDFTNSSSGFQYGKVELDDYPLTYDNSYYIAYEVKKKVNVLGLFEEGDPAANYFRALLADDDFVDYEAASLNNLQVSRIKNQQCVLLVNLNRISSGLSDALEQFAGNAGTVVVFPSAGADRNSYNSLFAKMQSNVISGEDTSRLEISTLNYRDAIFQNVFKKKEADADLPAVSNTFRFTKRNTIAQTILMTFRNGEPALFAHPVGNGKLYTFAFPASERNKAFLRHLIFVPAVYNIAMNSMSSQTIAYSIGIHNAVSIQQSQLPAGNEPLVFGKHESDDEYLPADKRSGDNRVQLDLGDFVQTAGFYDLKKQGQIIRPIAFNYNRNESIPEFYSPDEMEKILSKKGLLQFHFFQNNGQNVAETLNDLNNGKQLWKYFLLLTVLFIFIEGFIIRFWK